MTFWSFGRKYCCHAEDSVLYVCQECLFDARLSCYVTRVKSRSLLNVMVMSKEVHSMLSFYTDILVNDLYLVYSRRCLHSAVCRKTNIVSFYM